MSKKDDKIQLVPPEGAGGEDLQEPQYKAAGYAAPSGAAQPATGAGYDQPATMSDKPAVSYRYDRPAVGYNQPAAGYNQPAAGNNQPAMGYSQPARTAENYGYDQPATVNPSSSAVMQPSEPNQDYPWREGRRAANADGRVDRYRKLAAIVIVVVFAFAFVVGLSFWLARKHIHDGYIH